MGYKSTLPYATPMLTQEQKHAPIQWAIQYKDDHWSRTIFTDESCYQLFRHTIHETKVLKSNKFPKTSRRSWYEETSASRASLVIISLKQFWMTPTMFKFFKIISFLMQEDSLVDDGGYNRIVIQNIKVGWLSNSFLVKR